MSDQFDPLAPLLARKAELEAEAAGIQTQVVENRLRHEEIVDMIDRIHRKGRRKPGPQPGSVRPSRLAVVADEPLLPQRPDEIPPDEGAA